jgi:membrane protein DedA with SNARE-associated domain
MEFSPRVKFLISNGLKGIIWLAILLVGYFIFDKLVISKNPEVWLEHFYSQPKLIYLIYIASESFIGLFPPELFMIWAFNKGGLIQYILNVAFFAGVSYSLGYLNFLIGQFLYKRVIFRYFRKRYFQESWSQLRKYGLFLIIVAALTPVPWAAVCLLVGSAGYPSKRFLLYALFRVLRFIVYGYIVFQTHQF